MDFTITFVFEVSPARNIVFWQYAGFADKRAGFTECVGFAKSFSLKPLTAWFLTQLARKLLIYRHIKRGLVCSEYLD